MASYLSSAALPQSTPRIAYREVESRLPGRVAALSQFQTVEDHVKAVVSDGAVVVSLAPASVRVLGVGSRDGSAGLILNGRSMVLPGMPLHGLAEEGAIGPEETLTIECPAPYSEFVVSGCPRTVRGERGQAVSLWLEALGEAVLVCMY